MIKHKVVNQSGLEYRTGSEFELSNVFGTIQSSQVYYCVANFGESGSGLEVQCQGNFQTRY